MKKLPCLLAAALLFAVAPAVQATTLEEAHAVANDYYDGKLPAADALAQLAAIGADASNADGVRCVALARRSGIVADEGDPKGALPDLEEAVKLNPKSVAAFRIYGNVAADLKDFKKAVEMYDAAIQNAAADPAYSEEDAKSLRTARDVYSLVAAPVSAEAFQQEFADNVFAAEEKWTNRSVCLVGKIDRIGRGISGAPEVTLAVGPFKEIEVEVGKDEAPTVAKLKKGETLMAIVTLTKGGSAITHVKGWIAPDAWYK